jgi:nicotinate-nucleotide adenylyltransferase
LWIQRSPVQAREAVPSPSFDKRACHGRVQPLCGGRFLTKALPVPVLPRHSLPHAPVGATIGLFGGSFDPAHAGHVHVTRHALRAMALDQVWWLVSPGNPLKARGPAPIEQRVERACALMHHPRVQITALEADVKTRFTADTLKEILRLYPKQNFVWIMGADNLANFHAWEDWRTIMSMIPIAVIARPHQVRAAFASVAARAFRGARLPSRLAPSLPYCAAPAWCFVTIPMRDISSSQLRATGAWRPDGFVPDYEHSVSGAG